MVPPQPRAAPPMNFPFRFCLPALSFFAVAAFAQSPAPVDTSVQAANAETAASAAAPSPSATVPVEPPSLIPPNILPPPLSLPKTPAAPEIEQLNSYFKSTSLGKKADEHRLHVQMVALETRIRNDADLHALKAAALRAPTDLERRHGLKEYYELYFAKLRAGASTPELKEYLAAQEATRKLTLLQPRVRHETDAAEAAALAKASRGAVTSLPTPVQARAGETVRP